MFSTRRRITPPTNYDPKPGDINPCEVFGGRWYVHGPVQEKHPNGGTVDTYYVMSHSQGSRVCTVSGINLPGWQAKITAEFIALCGSVLPPYRYRP